MTIVTGTPKFEKLTGFEAADVGGSNWAVWTRDGAERMTGFMSETEARAMAAEMNKAI